MEKYNIIDIESIEEIDFEGKVYDIHVEDDHSYTVQDNIAVHNSVCATRKNTGVGTPQFSAIQNAKSGLKDYPAVKIIADGGIKNSGDIPKALAAGADVVMVGAVLAGTTETPGKVYPCPDTDLWNRQYYKVFGGSASGENKVSKGKEHKFVEGIMKTVPFKGKAKYILDEIIDGMQSSFSYTGAKDMKTFKEKVIIEIMSEGGRIESKL